MYVEVSVMFDCIRNLQNRLTKSIMKKRFQHFSLKSTKGMHDTTKKYGIHIIYMYIFIL